MTSEEWTPAFENMPKLHGNGDIDLLYFDATLIATTALIDDRKLILQWDTHAIENFRLSDYNRGLPMAVDLSVPMYVVENSHYKVQNGYKKSKFSETMLHFVLQSDDEILDVLCWRLPKIRLWEPDQCNLESLAPLVPRFD